jgi:predicted signal transduction protein with EAL and GGDEF domain
VVNRRRMGVSIAAFLDLFRVQTGKPDLMQAQVKALSTQIPLLFFITVVNTVALASTYYGLAPDSMPSAFRSSSPLVTLARDGTG